MKYKSYLFDFDGTLVDSMPSYVSAMSVILDEAGVRYESDLIKIITPLGYLGTARYYREHYGLSESEEDIVIRMKKYAYDEYAYRIPAKEKVVETLTGLKNLGADLHILTASPHEVLDVCLSRLGMTELFTNIWSCDDFGTGKADPQIYTAAAKRIGRNVSEILFIDDNLGACKTAKLAGMRVCGIYDKSSNEYVAQIKSAADHYVYSMDELKNL